MFTAREMASKKPLHKRGISGSLEGWMARATTNWRENGAGGVVGTRESNGPSWLEADEQTGLAPVSWSRYDGES